MLGWFEKHYKPISAIAALLTAFLALAALIGVKVQIDGAARIQREQSARDIYREFLSLSVQKPEFAAPDFCSLANSSQLPAYEAYVDYLLYTGEQVLSVDPEWQETIEVALAPHAAFLCDPKNTNNHPDPDVNALVIKLNAAQCQNIAPCN